MGKRMQCLAALLLAMAGVAGVTPVAGVAQESGVATAGRARTWNFGPFVNGGTGLNDRSDFQFLSLGVQGGKVLTPVVGPGLLRGRFEFGVNVMPFWQAYTPAQHTVNVQGSLYGFGGGTYTGLSVTPVIFRWDFGRGRGRLRPWFQAAGGSLYTTHKFPGELLVAKGAPGGTSVFNFTPQGGVGLRYFLRPERSVDFGVNAVHISSASLGDKNPGVNASLQFQIGYTWWK